MKITLAYKNYKELLPFCKMFLDSCYPIFKVNKIVSAIFIILYSLFYPFLSTRLKESDVLILFVCFLIMVMLYRLYAIAAFIKYNNKRIIINLEENNVVLPTKRILPINRKKSIIVNNHALILVLNVKLSFLNIGLFLTNPLCNEEDLSRLITHVKNG